MQGTLATKDDFFAALNKAIVDYGQSRGDKLPDDKDRNADCDALFRIITDLKNGSKSAVETSNSIDLYIKGMKTGPQILAPLFTIRLPTGNSKLAQLLRDVLKEERFSPENLAKIDEAAQAIAGAPASALPRARGKGRRK